MRAVTLLLLTLLFPVFVYAATININTADASLLDTLQGIGPTKAAAIVDYRSKHGPFAKIEDIQNVSGIGPATFANIKGSITVGVANEPVATQPAPQPLTAPVSSHTVQTPITSPTANIQDHAEAVTAPAAANELVTAGAPLPPPEPVAPRSRTDGLFSVWTLGLLGVIVAAGAVFILL